MIMLSEIGKDDELENIFVAENALMPWCNSLIKCYLKRCALIALTKQKEE